MDGRDVSCCSAPSPETNRYRTPNPKCPSSFEGAWFFNEEIAHRARPVDGRRKSHTHETFPASGALLLRMQPCQCYPFEYDKFCFRREEFFVDDEIVERIILGRYYGRSVRARLSRRGRYRAHGQGTSKRQRLKPVMKDRMDDDTLPSERGQSARM